MTSRDLRAHGRAGTALALLYVFLWSSAFVPSRVLSRMGQPLWVLTVRFAIASVLMAAVVIALRRPWPRTPAAWLQIAGYGLLANACYLGCTYEALRHLSSGMGRSSPAPTRCCSHWSPRRSSTSRSPRGRSQGSCSASVAS